jgi:hypothetical protein
VKTGAELDRVVPSWTEYADDLGLGQKMSDFQMKTEVFRANYFLISVPICVPLCSAALY